MEKIIDVTGLKKSYGDIEAVKGIDFYVEKGRLFAFLGPNGAGKSTTIDMISTFLKPDSGTVFVDGYELGKSDNDIRNIIGVVFQDGLLDELLTIEENLCVRGAFYGLRGQALRNAVRETAGQTGIEPLLKRPYGKLSGGQRRRCDIARGLINKPKILFLDEPTTGLDPQTRKNIWETIQQIQTESGMTVFLTTHYMEEAAEADFVIVIDDGKISAKGTPSELKQKFSCDRLILACTDKIALTDILNSQNLEYREISDTFEISLSTTMDALPIIERSREFISGFEVLRGTMDDVFLTITGKEMR